jgi:2-dehydro-3-deoxyphosphogluconate aldolase/(4S)-4-hydroxy-2-oxoglutarate aldolase
MEALRESAVRRIAELRVLPVIELPKEDVAAPLFEALIAGGLDVMEVTLRTDSAMKSIRAMRDAHPTR